MPAAAPEAAAATLAGKRVLVVEDEGIVALDLAFALEGMGMVVAAVCPTLAAGLEAARTLTLDVALLDVNLRGRTSLPIAEALAERGVPFAFMTGYESIAWPGDAPRLDKPYEEERMAETLAALLYPTAT